MSQHSDEALEVSCSRCGARPGIPCDMPTRSPAAAHIIRRDLAEQYRRVRAYEQHGKRSAQRRATNTPHRGAQVGPRG